MLGPPGDVRIVLDAVRADLERDRSARLASVEREVVEGHEIGLVAREIGHVLIFDSLAVRAASPEPSRS